MILMNDMLLLYNATKVKQIILLINLLKFANYAIYRNPRVSLQTFINFEIRSQLNF